MNTQSSEAHRNWTETHRNMVRLRVYEQSFERWVESVLDSIGSRMMKIGYSDREVTSALKRASVILWDESSSPLSQRRGNAIYHAYVKHEMDGKGPGDLWASQ